MHTYTYGCTGLFPGFGKYPRERQGNPAQYSCLQNSMDRETWQATVHGVTKSWTQLKQLSMHAYIYIYIYKIFHIYFNICKMLNIQKSLYAI